ncbi:hypothetical protein PM082_007637 [Marasmius tenuissimus]|nr:hypothetical protein PM082_007637 [Marasmius tenuissimus]
MIAIQHRQKGPSSHWNSEPASDARTASRAAGGATGWTRNYPRIFDTIYWLTGLLGKQQGWYVSPGEFYARVHAIDVEKRD